MTSNIADHAQQTTIYVGHLPRDATEDTIRELLSSYGKIKNIITRMTPTSLYAFVTLETHEQAATAIAECNYTKINGKPIQITWYATKPKDYAPDSKLVITNLPATVDESQLHEALEAYGSVVSCSIHRNIRGESTGVGSVQFENAEDAKRAHNALQNATISDQMITVDFFKPIDKRQDVILKLPPNVICVKGPDNMITPENLRNLFGKYGEISNTSVIEGYGVVFFANPASVSKTNAEFHDDKISVTTSVRKDVQQTVLKIVESQRVFISDISVSSEPEIIQHLENAGKIISHEFRTRSGGETVGFAQYESAEARNRAIQTLDRTTFGSQVTPIRVFPYYDKRLLHPDSGFLQINELPVTTTAKALREEMSQYGSLIAVSIAATAQATCIGYALFEEFSHAKRAHQECKYKNTFLYPPHPINDIIGGFCDNLQSRMVICYNLDKNVNSDSFHKMMSPVATVDGVWTSKADDDTKVVIFSCMTSSGVISAINFLRSRGTECDVLSVHIMQRANKILTSVPMQKDVRDRLLFCHGIDSTTTNEKLREIFESIGPVESAMIIYNPLNSESSMKGVVLFKDSTDAAVALKSPPSSYHFLSTFTISEFKFTGESRKSGYNSSSPQQPYLLPQPPMVVDQQQMPLAQPQMGHIPIGRNFKPREVMRKYIKDHADPKDQQRLLDEAAKICVNEINKIACEESKMQSWLESQTQH